eukprot:TRINITY_DN6609_c0_g1_i1.p3 TRINITY_DN6609_c0_g1~~TRINITY_DN6609_c0_g1_i1.p3  ORF type:complete len:111 (+),score=5.60 TRINITY_DN6609_c0_g1_i1:66-398(+)
MCIRDRVSTQSTWGQLIMSEEKIYQTKKNSRDSFNGAIIFQCPKFFLQLGQHQSEIAFKLLGKYSMKVHMQYHKLTNPMTIVMKDLSPQFYLFNLNLAILYHQLSPTSGR